MYNLCIANLGSIAFELVLTVSQLFWFNQTTGRDYSYDGFNKFRKEDEVLWLTEIITFMRVCNQYFIYIILVY